MTRKPIPEFTETELWIVRETIKERYRAELPLNVAQSDIRLDPAERETTACPAMHWRDSEGANFVIVKTGTDRFRCQFYYRGYEQYGTGKFEYDNIGDCVVTLLQVQADHAHKRAERLAKEGGATRLADGQQQPGAKNDSDEPWLYEPVIWE